MPTKRSTSANETVGALVARLAAFEERMDYLELYLKDLDPDENGRII